MKAQIVIYLVGAFVVTPVFACATYNAAQVSQAIQNSPYANAATKASSCTWGGAAAAESGGNTCASNGNNFGVLQLTRNNLPPGVTPSQYLNEPLQQQVNTWLQQAGPTGQGSSFNTINNAASTGGSLGGMQMTPGIAAACVQFGSGICSRDLASIQSTGQCPSAGNGGVRATNATLSNGTANLDGNNQSICSWGNVINQKIAASGCTNSGSGCNPSTGNSPATPLTTSSSPTLA